MRKTLQIPAEEVQPSVTDVLKGQNIPESAEIPVKTAELARQALSVFLVMARPAGLILEITPAEFLPIYYGEGQNAGRTPLDEIAGRTTGCALFAVTVGEAICREIGRQFEMSEFAQGAMLDAAASAGAERLADRAQESYRDYLSGSGGLDSFAALMSFSPGYCGWHITAQRKLFATLRPEEIGIHLNDSCLMQPLKSVSGVIITGPKEIFEFEDDFSFCGECRTRSCRDRIAALRKT